MNALMGVHLHLFGGHLVGLLESCSAFSISQFCSIACLLVVLDSSALALICLYARRAKILQRTSAILPLPGFKGRPNRVWVETCPPRSRSFYRARIAMALRFLCNLLRSKKILLWRVWKSGSGLSLGRPRCNPSRHTRRLIG